MKAAVVSVAAMLVVCFTGCSGPAQPVSQTADYKPVFASPTAGVSQPGSIRGDYDNAARAANLRDAVSRWEQFLRTRKPANGEYGDNFEKMLIDSATYELIRVYYLSGDRDKGDELLKQLDPLQLR